MNFTEAIAAITKATGLENSADIVSAINAHVTELTSDRDKHKTAADTANQNLEVITAAAGHSEGELTARLEATTKSLSESATNGKEKDNKIQSLEAELSTLKSGQLFAKASTIANANPEVLKKLLTNEDQLAISEDEKTVTVNGQPLQTWAEENHKPFVPVLIKPDQGKLPSGGGNAENNNPPPAQKASQRVGAKKYPGPVAAK